METVLVKKYSSANNGNIVTSPKHLAPVSYNVMYAGLFMLVATSFLEVLWKANPGSIFKKAAYILYPASFFFFFIGSLFYIFKQKLAFLFTKMHLIKILFFNFLLFILLMYGLIRGNNPNALIHNVMFYFSMSIFLILGADDRLFHSIIKFFTFVCWMAIIMCLLTYDIPFNSNVLNSQVSAAGDDQRFIDTIAYNFFRLPTYFALPLFIYGWTEKKSLWHYLQILSIVGFLSVNLMIFKFRGALVFSLMVAFAAIVVPGRLARKLKMVFLAVIAIFFVIGWLNTESGSVFLQRAESFNKSEEVVAYRAPESERYFQVMGYEWLWGRGLGGTFRYDNSEWGRNRTGVHIGWITLTLHGGLPLLFLTLSFYLPWFNKHKYRFVHDPYYTTAWLWIPISFLDWIVNPITIHAAYIPVAGLIFLLLARFGLRDVNEKQRIGLPALPPTEKLLNPAEI